jgi:5-methyltetrahydrofolate--homocysteine methyltransferase
MVDYAQLNQYMYEGKAPKVQEIIKKAIADGVPVNEILSEGLIAGMAVLGEDFKHNILYVPEVLIAARAMKAGLNELKPFLGEGTDVKKKGVIVIGTVKGDLHDIGKNLVSMMSEGAGYEVIDLGVDKSYEDFIDAAIKYKADIVGMSALLTTTMPYMKTVVDKFKENNLGHVKLVIGGAPINKAFAEEIGADGFGADAATSVEVFHQLMEAS